MAINQQCFPALNTQDREGSDRDHSRVSPPPPQSFKKELINVVFQELALFQIHIILAVVFVQGFLHGINLSELMVLRFIVWFFAGIVVMWNELILCVLELLGFSFLGLRYQINFINSIPTYQSSLVITTATLLLLIVLDWKLISAAHISKKSATLSEKDWKKI